MSTANPSLKAYRARRTLKASTEPQGKIIARAVPSRTLPKKKPVFVVQKHDASHLHYDFRIEINGVLKSWAIPKGPAATAGQKRLAIPTEDHPLEYAHFQGVIPEGNYGAGTVEIWDTGTYTNIKEKDGKLVSMNECLKKGKIEIALDGTKMKGNYALIKTKLGKGNQWLFFKMKEKFTPPRKQHQDKKESIIRIDKHNVTITNSTKDLFGKSHITKSDMIAYYQAIAPVMLPHLKNRAVTMHRFPDGITIEGFYQKDVGDYFPAWIKRAKIAKQEGGHNTYAVCNNAATLVYLANQACITPHVWLSKTDKLNKPDRMVFDLDPGKKSTFATVVTAALSLKTLLEQKKLQSFVMTTGSRGLHIVVPLSRRYDFDTVRTYAKNIAELLVAQDPAHYTTEARINKRKGRLYIDVTRNAFAQTTVAPYSIRAKLGAPVATPLNWKELEKNRIKSAQDFTIKNIPARIRKIGDPWKDIQKHPSVLKLKTDLNAILFEQK